MGIWDLDGDVGERKRWGKRDRDLVWEREFGSQLKAKCPICKINVIYKHDFDMGHKKSRAKSGSDNLRNIRPICHSCNKKMSTMHMAAYEKKYGVSATKKTPGKSTSTKKTPGKSTSTKKTPGKSTSTKKKKRKRSIWDLD